MITHIATASIETKWAAFACHVYRRPDGIEHAALVLGDMAGAPLVRVHSVVLGHPADARDYPDKQPR